MSAPVEVIRREAGIVVAQTCREIDSSNADAVAAGLQGALTERDSALVVDLSCVEYIGSAGVHVLHDLARRVGGEGRRLRVVAGASPIVERLFELVSMDRLVPVDASVDDALDELKRP